MREQPLDLRESWAAIRRRWIVIAILAVVGFCAGFAYGLARPPQASAAVEVLLSPPSAASANAPTVDMKAQAAIATSARVLQPAAKKLSLPLSELQREVSAGAVGDSIIRIEVRTPDGKQALGRASAVGQSYVAFAKTLGTNPITLQTTSEVPSTIGKGLKNGLIGLAAGLLVGTIIVLLSARRDHRLRSRDAIATSIGVPVLASLEADPNKSIADWIQLLEHFESTPANAWTLRRVLQNMAPSDFTGQFTIRVISFVGDQAALTTGPQLALFASESGIPTRLAPDENMALESLIAACAALRTSSHSERLLTFGSEGQAWHGPLGRPVHWDDDPSLTQAQLIVSVFSVERDQPLLPPFVGPTILSVSSGFAVVDDLARVALASARAGLGIDGIVVINPDPTDHTVGLVRDRDNLRWRASVNGAQNGNGSSAVGPTRRQEETRWPV